MSGNDFLGQRKEIASKILHRLYCYPQVVAVLINGSLAWGSEDSLKQESDIDLDIILDDKLPSLFPQNAEFSSFKVHYNKLLKQNMIDYASWKYEVQNVMVGLHFLPIKCFIEVCSLDYKSLQETACLREYRIRPKDKPSIYIQKSFSGKSYEYVCEKEFINEGIITRTPLAIIVNGEYYNGLLPDKYLSYPIIYSKKDSVYASIYNLKKNLIQRLKVEMSSEKSNTMNLGNLLHARDRMPSCEIQHLNLESRIIDLFHEDMLLS